jgi:nitroreductase
VCPADAIQLSPDLHPLDDDSGYLDAITPEALEYFLAYRRSTRRFRDKPVPQDLIARVVQAGRYIPSGGNRHAYEFTVLTDERIKQQLLEKFSKYYDRIRKLMSNAVVKSIATLFLGAYERAFLNDPDYGERMKDLLDRFHAGGDPVFYRAPVVIIIHSKELIPTPKEDSFLAGYNIVLMAQTLGLGTCFVSLAQKGLNANKHYKALVGIPPEDSVNAVILMGYPDVKYHRAVPKAEKHIHFR